ncbi:EAL domain-containing protein [Noviherbaspirillum saxi]|uniref:EAL domain-containing protein n=1 Tax=Noviherbaspirillum saxi TaxID=2320863 RepID=A0A3A3FSW5_9BURK|nr:EAL domain-containing protein [Noviherbaspirillum saxi]RJF99272.1 EAL domain-containing protein [Noviherbaspirillum saxi]
MQDSFQLPVEQCALGILWLGADGIITHANDASMHLTGATVEAMIGKPIWAYIVELDSTAWKELSKSVTAEKSKQLQVTIRMDNRGSASAEAHFQLIDVGGSTRFAVFLQGIVTRVRTEELFLLQHNLLVAVARGESLDKLLNQLCRDVEKIAPELLCSIMLLDEQDRVHVVAAPSIPQSYAQALEGAQIGPDAGSCGTALYFNQPVEVSDIATDPLWKNYRDMVLPIGLVASWSSPIKSRDGGVLGTFAVYFREPREPSEFHKQLVAVCTHLTGIAIERNEADKKLHDLAFYDSLTGLPNRKLLRDRAAVALANAAHTGTQLAILFVDLDRFKVINDALGHSGGDQFLRMMAEQFNNVVRQADTMSRLGSDEFVLVLPLCDSLQAAHLAQRLLEIAARPVRIEDRTFTSSASIGISLYPDDATDFESLLRYADMAMHQSKSAGRSNYRFFSRELNASIQQSVVLEHALRRAIADHRLSVYYQPKIDLRHGTVYGVEALARWYDPELGVVSPVRFIPVAEDCGLIGELGNWVLDEACRQLAQWRADGLDVPSVAVNVSARQLVQKDLPETIAQILQCYALEPSSLILEITESSMIQDDAQPLKAIHELGVKLAVDDFGTGYSSLSYLKRFPVHELKLDQSFVHHLASNKDDRELASAVINIGRALHLTVVAEGVENQDQLSFLHAQHCDVVQGYYYSPPLSAHDFHNWMLARR